MKKLYIIIFILFVFVKYNKAQDFHLSQIYAAPLYLNPALTAQNLEKGTDYRVSSLYRSQWGKISTKPFTTGYFSFDSKFGDKWGVGINMVNNQAGAPTFRTTNLMLNGSYNIMNDPNGEHILTTGVQIGLMNKSFKTNSLYFDQQYSSTTGTFDQNLSSGETFTSKSTYHLDAGWGVYYKYQPKGQIYSPFAGLSLGHISFPNQRFTGGKEAYPMQWKVNIGAGFQVKENIKITPSFLYMYQKKAHEAYFNVYGTYQLENKDYDLRAGLGYRSKDAFVIALGMRYKEIKGMISYDLNTSYLANYTNGRGGFEIGVSYCGIYKNEKIKSFMMFK